MTIDAATTASLGDRYHGGGTARFAHGLLVIASPDSTDDHAGWDPAREPVHAGPDSLYVGVRQSASGPVAVACLEEPAPHGALDVLFRGEITLARASIALYDPHGQLRLERPVERDLNRITLYGDDPDEPAEIVVVLGVPDEKRSPRQP
ncbi:hypothetical protein VSH64_08135 [Amycolatopsis rhabdoformis]|uniref:Uncharacterized protein n=1 Tax=Amycolatopsis rhabdoformis TaxID=1448059 RepID=A0ABZ1ICC1_9PSEU|nr:hypothetical protein [Amycolatopsis rhabdoformis]WSE32075.1 hypothetical protein VSH64_08135 [Amycolatopsis rhabdoformis]